MSQVRLRGQLICKNADEAALVRHHLPLHVRLTGDEPGCVSFEVRPTEDPLVWLVEEEFVDVIAFEAHQARIAASEWGLMTTGIERRYVVEGLADA